MKPSQPAMKMGSELCSLLFGSVLIEENAIFIHRSHFSSSISPHPEDDAGGGAGTVGGDGFVDLAEREFVGDKSIKCHSADADEVDEAGDFEIGRDAAAVGAFEDFFEMEGKGVNRGFVTGSGDADEDGAAVGMGEVVGEFDDAGVAGGIDHDIGAGFSDDGADFFGESGAFGGGVEGVGEAPAGGHLELGVVEIYADDGVGADHAGGLGDIQADAADAKDNDALADFKLGVVVDDAYGGGDGATEERGGAEVEVLGDDGEAVFGNDGFVIECGDPAGIHGLRAPTVFGRLGLKAARGSPMQNDMVAGLDPGHALPHPLDGAGPFVSEKVWKEFVGTLGGLDFIDLCTADAAVFEADMDLTKGKLLRHLEFGEFERSVGLNEDGGFHGVRRGLLFVEGAEFFNGGGEDGNDFAVEAGAMIDEGLWKPVFEAVVATEGFLSGSTGDDQKLSVFFA